MAPETVMGNSGYERTDHPMCPSRRVANYGLVQVRASTAGDEAITSPIDQSQILPNGGLLDESVCKQLNHKQLNPETGNSVRESY